MLIYYGLKLVRTRLFLLTCSFLLLFCSCKSKEVDYVENEPSAVLENHFKRNIENSVFYLDSLKYVLGETQSIYYYKLARAEFKKIEPILAFVDKGNYKFLNQPNLLKVEEEDATDIKIKKPSGFQVLEEQLFEKTLPFNAIIKNISLIQERLRLIKKNTHLKLKKHHIIWLLRDAIARVALRGITGFDSPVLEDSLEEAKIVYNQIEIILNNYSSHFKDDAILKLWNKELLITQIDLDAHFNTFNRYDFIKSHSHKQLRLLVKTQKDWDVVFPFELAFKNELTSFFSDQTFNLNFFSDSNEPINDLKQKIALGSQLFGDKRLSKSKTMACVSCHQSNLSFTDGLKTFPKQNRNTPTLNYAALQQSFFYDARAGSLEGQIVSVVNNSDEFHSDLKTITEAVRKDSVYTNQFKELYGIVNDRAIRQAVATYIRSLAPFNSKFDRNINDLENTLTKNEINGFNLFNGKAKCATCHFAPVFNGTVPPSFKESELEAIGVPETTSNPSEISKDLGRYDVFKTKQRKHFFKTPTIRNVNRTSPYMHNGIYNTLEEILIFYNNGGGKGVGIDLEYQTLPTDSLNLSEQEMKDIISFLKTLDDQDSDKLY